MVAVNRKVFTSTKLQPSDDRRDAPTVHHIQPLEDSRWSRFLERHPDSSVFHTTAWLSALQRTYDYQPIAFTTSAPGTELQNGLVACYVDSWLTGRRMVSLPFSDHCELLMDNPISRSAVLSSVQRELHARKLGYIELRPLAEFTSTGPLFQSNYEFLTHRIDLSPSLEALFHACHKDSTQRKIRRATREGLIYEEGRSEQLLDAFYELLLLTRRRHQIPPQPKLWFQSLIATFGEDLKIRVALKDRTPVASILTLSHKRTLVYKYGCSDPQFNNLGGMHLLFWTSIEEAKRNGMEVFDLGRSETDNPGLITFKDRWGSTRSTLTYSRLAASGKFKNHYRPSGPDSRSRLMKRIFSHLPNRLQYSVGNLLYKHIG